MANVFENGSNRWKAIAFAAFVTGTLDISAAIVQTLLANRDPLVMLKFIASGIFGMAALKGGLSYSLLGLLFHYCIATIWTTFFFIVYPKVKLLQKNRIATGIGYGCIVWVGMSQIVLPLSKTPELPFNLQGAVIAILILIAAIGIPLSFLAGRFYRVLD